MNVGRGAEGQFLSTFYFYAFFRKNNASRRIKEV